jgi:aminoglycoside 3-N-acetyltransferase
MEPTCDSLTLTEDLLRLGVGKGTEVLVHSSLSAIGYVEGGAAAVIDSLLRAVDPLEGTVLVPTLTGTDIDGPDRPPHFDLRASACWTGRIPETFRQRGDARRSMNPTHSVSAIGAGAASLTTGHEDCWTTCGYGSPYYRLARRNGKILLLGVGLDSNTTFHTAEEIAGVDYHLQQRPVQCTMTDRDGAVISRLTMLHDWGTPRVFSAAEDEFMEQGFMKAGMVGSAKCLLIEAGPMLDYTVNKLRKQPSWLVLSNQYRIGTEGTQ